MKIHITDTNVEVIGRFPVTASPQLTDGEMLSRCMLRPPDRAAWKVFVQRYHKTIENSIRETLQRKLGERFNESDVERLTIQVYQTLIEDHCYRLRQLEGDFIEALKPYLILTAINVALAHVRSDT